MIGTLREQVYKLVNNNKKSMIRKKMLKLLTIFREFNYFQFK